MDPKSDFAERPLPDQPHKFVVINTGHRDLWSWLRGKMPDVSNQLLLVLFKLYLELSTGPKVLIHSRLKGTDVFFG